jgi:hypothetical protein
MELLGGAYSTRSPLGLACRCIEVFPERNRKDGPETYTHYQRPGLRQLALAPLPARGRGVFRASNGNGYAVVGNNVYSVAQGFIYTQLGQLTSPVPGTPLCSFRDNGTNAFLVDSSGFGYTWNITTNAGFAQIVDPTGTFQGSIKADYLDTFLLWVLPNSNLFGSTLSNELVFDPTYVAGKTGYPDPLQTLFVNRHELLLFGQVKSEIWYDAGNPLFPFAILPGAYIEWGCLAPRSVAAIDINVYWLGQGEFGDGLVLKQRGYQTTVISNYAISFAIQQMKRNGADLSDAIAFTYVLEGHIFYQLTFISGNQTWVFDESIADPELAWHQRGYTDAQGQLQRSRLVSAAFINNVLVGQDWQNGTLYQLDPDYYFDYVDDGDGQGAFARPISCTRTFPQIKISDGPQGPQLLDGKTIRINSFTADFEGGEAPLNPNGSPPQIGLRLSFDRSKRFGNFVLQNSGRPGQFDATPKWGPLGIGRYPVLELNWSIPGPAALNGGWIDAEVLAK